MISSVLTNDDSRQYYITTSSCPDWANIGTHVSGYITHLTRSNNEIITTDDIVTKQDLLNEDFLWQSLYIILCNKNPDKAAEYETLLNIYNKDYHKTVLAIETASNNCE